MESPKMSSQAFLGAGDVYISRYDPTTATFLPYEGPIGTDKFAIKPNSDLKEATAKGKTNYGQVIESVPVPKPSDITIDFSQVDRITIETALFGESTAINTPSATVTDEVLVAKLGKWAPLLNANLAAAVVVTNSTAATTYTKDVDYEVNYRLGWIRAIVGGAITDNQSLKVDYVSNASTGTLIAGAKRTQVRARFKLDGKNFADDLPVICTVHEAVLTPDSEFDFLANDFGKISLKGRMKTPVGKNEPFTVELLDTN